jgi:hypothetical protein
MGRWDVNTAFFISSPCLHNRRDSATVFLQVLKVMRLLRDVSTIPESLCDEKGERVFHNGQRGSKAGYRYGEKGGQPQKLNPLGVYWHGCSQRKSSLLHKDERHFFSRQRRRWDRRGRGPFPRPSIDRDTGRIPRPSRPILRFIGIVIQSVPGRL